MGMDAYALSGWLYKLLEAAERLEELTPFSAGQVQRELKLGYGQASVIVDLFIELRIVSLTRDSEGGHTPLMSPCKAAFTVIRYLHEHLPDGEPPKAFPFGASEDSTEAGEPYGVEDDGHTVLA